MTRAHSSPSSLPADAIPDSRPPRRAYFPSLDGLRAISFIGVFLHHYVGFPYGWAGVDIFFVLSGFLITGILYDTRDDEHRVRNFYIRRTLRIFPLYYGVFLVILLLTPLMHWHWTWQWISWPLYLGNFLRFLYPHQHDAFVSAFADAQLVSQTRHHLVIYLGHFWTLCVEEQFYLVWPWIVFAVRNRRKLIYICAVCIVVLPFVRAVALAHMPAALVEGEVVLHSTPFRFDTLMVGSLVALLYRGTHYRQMQRAAQIILPLPILGVSYAVFCRLRFGSYTYPAVLPTWLPSVVAIFAAAVLLRTLIPGTMAYRICHLRWLRAIGTVSYGAYVFHDIPHNVYIAVAAVFFHHHVQTLSTLLAFIATMVLAFASYRYFEAPILRYKDRLTSTA